MPNIAARISKIAHTLEKLSKTKVVNKELLKVLAEELRDLEYQIVHA